MFFPFFRGGASEAFVIFPFWVVVYAFSSLYLYQFSGKKKKPNPKLFGPDIFRWGGGRPREGMWAKKFGMCFETQGNQTFSRDIHILGVPEKFEKERICVQFSSTNFPASFRELFQGGNGGFPTPVRGTMFVRNGAVTPGQSRECDVTTFVKSLCDNCVTVQWRHAGCRASPYRHSGCHVKVVPPG